MKSNQVSVLVVLLLCLVMGGFLYVVDRSSDEEAGWIPSELYGELGARSYEGSSFSDVTFSGGGNSDGVAVSMRNGSFSLRTRARHISSPNSLVANGVPGKSADFLGALSPNSPIASSPNSLIGHMTSSAEFHSFGGGSNMAMGSYTSSSNNLIASSPAIGSYSPSPSSPIALSPNASGVGFNNLPSLQGGDGGRPVVSAEQAIMSASSSANGLFGGMITSYGTASYSDYVGMSGGKPSGVRGRQNATPGMGNGWWNWLDKWVEDNGEEYIVEHDGNKYYLIDWDQLYAAWEDFVENYWNSGMGDPPTFEDWWDWYSSTMYGGAYGEFGDGSYYQHGNYLFTPVGDVLPLVLLALMYMIILFVKRNKNRAIMIKKFFSALALVLFATAVVAQSGLTCDDPIPVDKSYVGKVEAGSELWYTAWSYDLPLHVYFSPDSADTDWGPEVLVDFTCIPGVYEDHKLDSVLKILEAMEITMPVEFLCDEVIRNGKVEWDLSIDQKYRDQLTEYGLTHNVQAFVKVYFPYSGEISLTPDTAFQSCIENGHYTQLGDTIDIAANDTENMLVLPYSEWKNDSVRFVWIGEKPARVWVAEDECQFTPTDASVYVKAKYDIDKDTPKKLYQAEMQSAIDNWIGAGIFYAKVISEAPGRLVVERIPLGEIQGDAILLKHGQPVQLNADDNRVFCFPKTWKSTEFLAGTSSSMTMHVSNVSEFEIGDANVIRTYPFFIESGNRNLQLTSGDISSLAASATDDYIYVRFDCNSATTLTPALWNAGQCIENTIWIPLGQTISIPASDKNVYRLIYEDIAGYDLTVTWGQKNVGVAIYVASYCNFTTTAPDKLKTINVKKNSSITVKSTDVDSWATSLEEEGFLYLQFSASRKGNVTFISDKPATPDPVYTTMSETLCYGESYTWNGQTYSVSGEYQQTLVAANGADSIVTLKLTILPEVPATTEKAEIIAGETYTWNGKDYTEAGEYTITLQDENGCDYQATLILNVLPPLSPCLQASVKLNVGDELKVNLASAFTVYAIDYNAWMQQAVTLVWTGVEPLHAFVAETCEFALAPYNRYVHAYVPVPAQGDWVLDMDALAPYVDEDGYLYVRFLTEFEGTLKVGQ